MFDFFEEIMSIMVGNKSEKEIFVSLKNTLQYLVHLL